MGEAFCPEAAGRGREQHLRVFLKIGRKTLESWSRLPRTLDSAWITPAY